MEKTCAAGICHCDSFNGLVGSISLSCGGGGVESEEGDAGEWVVLK